MPNSERIIEKGKFRSQTIGRMRNSAFEVEKSR